MSEILKSELAARSLFRIEKKSSPKLLRGLSSGSKKKSSLSEEIMSVCTGTGSLLGGDNSS